MSPEGLALLAASPAKQLEETFPEKFLSQQGLYWGRDSRMRVASFVRVESSASNPPTP